MFRKFKKTKIIVCQNVNFLLNLLNSYDGSRRRRDRSKRSHRRQSLEPDTKQQRRHRKPLNHQNGEAVRAKVSQRNFYFSTPIKRKTHFMGRKTQKKCFIINCWWNLLEIQSQTISHRSTIITNHINCLAPFSLETRIFNCKTLDESRRAKTKGKTFSPNYRFLASPKKYFMTFYIERISISRQCSISISLLDVCSH